MSRPPRTPAGRSARARFAGEAPDFRRRGFWLVLAFVAMAIAVFARLVDVQVLQGKALAAQAAAQHTTSVTVHGNRGVILDRNGRVVASNRTVYDVFADPHLVDPSQHNAVASQVAPVLRVSQASILHALQQPNEFDYLAKGVSQDVEIKLQALNLPGIATIPTQQRVYEPSPVPGSSFAANLIGFVNHDGSGQYGIEQYYDSVLADHPGTRRRSPTFSATPSC